MSAPTNKYLTCAAEDPPVECLHRIRADISIAWTSGYLWGLGTCAGAAVLTALVPWLVGGVS